MIIYKATNKINGLIYIGQTKRSLNERIRDHKSCNNKTIFNLELKKYGIENFEWKIVEICLTQKYADENEKYYILLYDTCNPDKGYNRTKGGTDFNKGKIFDEEYRKKMSENGKGKMLGYKHTEEAKKNMSDAQKSYVHKKGYIRSEETKKKISESRKGIKYTDEHKEKLRLALLNRKRNEKGMFI